MSFAGMHNMFMNGIISINQERDEINFRASIPTKVGNHHLMAGDTVAIPRNYGTYGSHWPRTPILGTEEKFEEPSGLDEYLADEEPEKDNNIIFKDNERICKDETNNTNS